MLPDYSKLKRARNGGRPPYTAINLVRFLFEHHQSYKSSPEQAKEFTRADLCVHLGVSRTHLSNVLSDPILKPIIDELLAGFGVKVIRGARGKERFVRLETNLRERVDQG